MFKSGFSFVEVLQIYFFARGLIAAARVDEDPSDPGSERAESIAAFIADPQNFDKLVKINSRLAVLDTPALRARVGAWIEAVGSAIINATHAVSEGRALLDIIKSAD